MLDRARDLLPALAGLAHVLRRAVVGLQAAEAQMARACHTLGDAHGGRTRRHPAAPAADVDLDQHVDSDARLRRGRLDLGDVVDVVRADADLGLAGQRRQPLELGGAGDLVGDEHVANAAGDHHLGLRHLLAAHPDGAERHLPRGNVGRLVRLGMRPQANAGTLGEVRHALEIALERVEIDQQRRRVDRGQRRADLRQGGERAWAS